MSFSLNERNLKGTNTAIQTFASINIDRINKKINGFSQLQKRPIKTFKSLNLFLIYFYFLINIHLWLVIPLPLFP